MLICRSLNNYLYDSSGFIAYYNHTTTYTKTPFQSSRPPPESIKPFCKLINPLPLCWKTVEVTITGENFGTRANGNMAPRQSKFSRGVVKQKPVRNSAKPPKSQTLDLMPKVLSL